MAARLIVAGMAVDVGMSEVDKKAEVVSKLLREANVAEGVINKVVAQVGMGT